jgi:hypothetical protein
MRILRRLLPVLLVLLTVHTAAAKDPERVEWSKDWPKFRLAEGLATIALGATTIAFSFHHPSGTNYSGGILFDDWVRDHLKGTSFQQQSDWAKVSDYAFKGGVLLPNIVDVWIVALGVHQNAEVGIEMLMMNLQSLGIAGVLSVGSQRFVGRARPYQQDCGKDGKVRDANGNALWNSCGGDEDNQSFYSGHVAAVATMAGLTCAHHQHLPLYGGGVADLAPCVVMWGITAANGVGRIVADKHYASDVTLGLGVGFLAGYVVPSVLHYGFGSGKAAGEVKTGSIIMVPVPQVYANGGGLGMAGMF